MTPDGVTYREDAGSPAVESVPLAHVSLELGHLYMEDFRRGPDYLVDYFRAVTPWVAAARKSIEQRLGKTKPRISTCFLVDDYFSQLERPERIIGMIREAADRNDLEIDYLARESGCAVADGVELAELLKGYLVPEPWPISNGRSPEVAHTGWLSNGKRTPDYHGPRPPTDQTGWLSNDAPALVLGAPGAMTDVSWRPPTQSAPNRHAIFLDVELWDDNLWSCAYLAAVWQCARLGLLRQHGRHVVRPVRLTGPIPEQWADVPPVLQLTDRPQAFCAYRTLSILGSRFLEIEVATRVVLGQVYVPSAVTEQLFARAAKENYKLPDRVLDRIDYCFIGDNPAGY